MDYVELSCSSEPEKSALLSKSMVHLAYRVSKASFQVHQPTNGAQTNNESPDAKFERAMVTIEGLISEALPLLGHSEENAHLENFLHQKSLC